MSPPEPGREEPSPLLSKRSERRRSLAGQEVLRGRLRVHDPFELVRWLALSQPDPRKALAELVQNSLDAGARRVTVTRVRERGVPCLRIFDDGAGVIPELDRAEALRYVATHIGHSRKRQLSPQERLELMTQGQYGIGLLGFWSLGEALEIRSFVPGQRPYRLVLYRDRPDFLIEPLRSSGLFPERATVVVVAHLHAGAMGALVARRAADYLAAELRGQLLAREVELMVEDRIARGTAEKMVAVRPRRFLGERVALPEHVDVPGYPPVRLEIYVAGDGESDSICVYGAGTVVAESFHELAFLLLDRPPWNDARLTGLVDFPAFTVAPGSRRGVVADAAAAAFARALRAVEPLLEEALDHLERRRAEELDRRLLRDLQRAFRGLFREQPRYTLLPVGNGEGRGEGPASESGAAGEVGGVAATEAAAGGSVATPSSSEEDADGLDTTTATPELPFPPGPLAAVRVQPSPVRLYLGAARRVRAQAIDDRGRTAAGPVSFHWRLDGDLARLVVVDGEPVAVVEAGDDVGTAALEVVARSLHGAEARGEGVLIVSDEPAGRRTDEGIPEPELVDFPGADWRSRMHEGHWRVNSAHPEYRAVHASPALKLRYLALLFAKEVVLRSAHDPRLEGPLEQLVEVAAYADRNLAGRRKG